MAYSAEISRQNPSCFLFIIDQSGSMTDNFSNPPKPKAQGVSDAINKLLSNLVIKCAKSEGVRDYYYVGVLGYGKNIGPAFTGSIAGNDLVSISEIANNPARIEERTKKVDDGAGGLIEQKVKFPIWFDPTAVGGTPMTNAFQQVNQIIGNWINQHPDSFPPVVIHFTDGESTDGDPTSEMQNLTNLGTSDGNVLLFNIHLSANSNSSTLEFPNNTESLPDKYAEMLYNSASKLTPFMIEIAKKEFGYNVDTNSKAFMLNVNEVRGIIEALEIGTRPSNLR